MTYVNRDVIDDAIEEEMYLLAIVLLLSRNEDALRDIASAVKGER